MHTALIKGLRDQMLKKDDSEDEEEVKKIEMSKLAALKADLD